MISWKETALYKTMRDRLRYEYCNKCRSFNSHTNEKLNKCIHGYSETYPAYNWILHCDKYKLNPETGKKIACYKRK